MAPRKNEAASSCRQFPTPINTTLANSSTSGKGSFSIKKSRSSATRPNSVKVSPEKMAKITPEKSKEPFRFRWMKKLKLKKAADDPREFADTKANTSNNNKSTKKTRGSTSPKNFQTLIGFNTTSEVGTESSPAAAPSTPRKYLFGVKVTGTKDGETEMKGGGDGGGEEYDSSDSDEYGLFEDDEDDGANDTPGSSGQGWTPPKDVHGQLVGPNHPSVPKSANTMEKAKRKERAPSNEPHDPNGRHPGRKLVHWHRARMMEKLLLMVQYECHRANIVIPWDKVVHRLRPGSSGPSATQMLNKMRDILVVEGHMIPPPMGRGTVPQDETIRGLVQDEDQDEPNMTRVVRWDEEIEHRKESLPLPEGVFRGSGNYARDEDGRRSKSGAARSKKPLRAKLPAEYIQSVKATKNSVPTDSAKKRRERRSKRDRSAVDREERGDIADPADLPSDEEWDPKVTKKAKTSRRRSTRKSAVKIELETDGDAAMNRTPSMMNFGTPDEVTSNNASLPIKLAISPEKLANFPASESGIPASHTRTVKYNTDSEDADATDVDVEYEEVEQEMDENHSEYDAAGTKELGVEEFISPQSRLLKYCGHMADQSYRGPLEHGTLEQFSNALAAGIDPRIHGHKYMASQNHTDNSLFGSQGSTSYADTVALSCANSQAPDQPAPRYVSPQVVFANVNDHGSGMQRAVSATLNTPFQPLGLDPDDDPFVDHNVFTPPYAPPPYAMTQQLEGSHTPPYHSFSSQTPSSQALAHMSSVHHYDAHSQNVHDGHFNGYRGMNAPHSHDHGDFVNAPGRIYEDPPEQSYHSAELMGEGWNDGLPSQTDAHMEFPAEYYHQSHFDENDENDHPSGLHSPGYVSYDGPVVHHQ